MLGAGKAVAAEASEKGLRQSVMGWCFNPRKVKPVELAAKCLEFGITGIEGISADAYPEVRKLGTEISLVSGGHGFKEGACNPEFRGKVVEGIKKGIALAKEVGLKRVITFAGMTWTSVSIL